MAFFYLPNPHTHHIQPFLPSPITEAPLNVPSAVSILKQASLKTSDIRLKLDLAKVINLLQDYVKNPCSVSGLGPPPSVGGLIHIVEQESSSCRSMGDSQSSLCVPLSASAISRECSDRDSAGCNILAVSSKVMNKENGPVSQIKTLQCKNTVTYNFLDDNEKSCKLNVLNEELTQQNGLLKQSLGTLIEALRKGGLIESSYLPADMEGANLSEVCSSISQSDLCSKVASLEAMKNILATHKEELTQNIQGQNRKWQSKISELQQQIDVLRMELTHRNEELQQTKNLLLISGERVQHLEQSAAAREQEGARRADQVQKYEMLLFVKEEEVVSLRALNSDLENRLAALTSEPKSGRRVYKKYFQDIQKGLSATFS